LFQTEHETGKELGKEQHGEPPVVGRACRAPTFTADRRCCGPFRDDDFGPPHAIRSPDVRPNPALPGRFGVGLQRRYPMAAAIFFPAFSASGLRTASSSTPATPINVFTIAWAIISFSSFRGPRLLRPSKEGMRGGEEV